MKARTLIPALALALVALAGCDGKKNQPAPGATATQPAATNQAPTGTEPPAAAATTGAVDDAAALEIDLAALDPAKATLTAPDKFKAHFETTAGDFTVEVTRDWAPNGADRFYNLVKAGFFNDVAVFRVIDGFMAQFGIHGNPEVSKKWADAKIPDDPSKEGVSNKPGYVTFATAGPNTRTTQLFINYGDNSRLDQQGFTPFGVVTEGMETVNKFYKGYGEGAPMGRGPAQGRIQAEGNKYLRADFPELTYIKKATIVGEEGAAPAAAAADGDKPAAGAATKAYEAGTYKDTAITGGGFEGAQVRFNVTDAGKVQGSFKGSREGKGFIIPLEGSIDKDGAFTASGEKGTNKASVTGRFNNGQLSGRVEGSVNKQGFKVNFAAKK